MKATKGRVYNSQFEMQSIVAGRVWWQEHEAATVTLHPQLRNRQEMNTDVQLFLFSFSFGPGHQTWNGAALIQGGSPYLSGPNRNSKVLRDDSRPHQLGTHL